MSPQLLLDLALLVVHEVEQLLLLEHVGYLKHKCRELFDILTDRARVLETFHVFPCYVSHILKVELFFYFSLKGISCVYDAHIFFYIGKPLTPP